jgi:prepilin-type N-terminal cleavage/methylation domain-containing protein
MKDQLNKQERRIARTAFTLVEMLIVLTMLGTITAMALPNVNRTVRQRRVIAAATALSSEMESAFSLAARQRRPIRITYNSASGEVRIADRASGAIFRRRALGATSEYRLTGTSMSPGVVDLFPTGVASAAFSFSLTNGSFQRQVTVTRVGLTRVLP